MSELLTLKEMDRDGASQEQVAELAGDSRAGFLRKAVISGGTILGRTRWPLALATVLLTTLALAIGAQAATAPTLGTASSFAVLAGSTVTNTGPSVIGGNVGVSSGSAVTGFPPGLVTPPGTIHVADAVATQAQSDATAAYTNLAGQTCNTSLTGQDLGGKTLTPGVYCFSTSAQLTGTLTLDAQGDPNAVFIFQIGSTLTTASNSSVALINGASACNVFFQVGSSATLGTATLFTGNILASASISLTTGAVLAGRALAQTGAVTLDSNTISPSVCAPVATAATAVTLRSFTAARSARSVMLKWRTASETETLGFNLYGQVNGKRVKLNRTLVAAKNNTRGASYSFRYRVPSGKTAPSRLWLQVVDRDGSRSWYTARSGARA